MEGSRANARAGTAHLQMPESKLYCCQGCVLDNHGIVTYDDLDPMSRAMRFMTPGH